MACDEWVWLGDQTCKVVASGEAEPLCKQCAVRLVPAGTQPDGHVKDHRRARYEADCEHPWHYQPSTAEPTNPCPGCGYEEVTTGE